MRSGLFGPDDRLCQVVEVGHEFEVAPPFIWRPVGDQLTAYSATWDPGAEEVRAIMPDLIETKAAARRQLRAAARAPLRIDAAGEGEMAVDPETQLGLLWSLVAAGMAGEGEDDVEWTDPHGRLRRLSRPQAGRVARQIAHVTARRQAKLVRALADVDAAESAESVAAAAASVDFDALD